MNIILYLAEAFLVAYIVRLVAYRLKIPAVSGYVIGGVILGGSLFYWIPGSRKFTEQWLFTENARSQLVFITHIALGTIALSIGAELEWKRIKSLGKSIFCIALFESFGAFLLVTLVIGIVWRDFSLAVILGAVSSATAPAATVAVIQQYRARGPLTHTILAVVGIDDAISFMIFAFAITLTKGYFRHEAFNVVNGLVKPILEIIISLSIGGVIGFIGARLLITAKDQESIIFILAAVVLWITSIAAMTDVSELLANMCCGVVIANVYPHLIHKIRSSFSSFMPLFYALFFIIGGAYLDLSVVPGIWAVALMYFTIRATGKILGASAGARMAGALPRVKKYIGFTLLPQVGAAIALALVVHHEFGSGDYGRAGINLAQTTINVLLVTTLMTEFIGPYLTKMSLIKSGEAKE